MKVGFSYSRCLKDIYDGVVPFEDVLVIVARTHFDPTIKDHWNSIWRGYTTQGGWSYAEWEGYEDKEEEFKALTLKLYHAGKLHQPRQYGAFPTRDSVIWRELS